MLASVMIVALLVIAMILLTGFASDAKDPARVRLLLRLRTGAQALSVVAILVAAWMVKNG